MKLKNKTVEQYYRVINNPGFFVKNCQFPKEIRDFFRKNINLLIQGEKNIQDSIQAAINTFVEQNKGEKQNEYTIKIADEYQNEWNQELSKIYEADCELEFDTLNQEMANQILNLNMTLIEEDFINSFINKEQN